MKLALDAGMYRFLPYYFFNSIIYITFMILLISLFFV